MLDERLRPSINGHQVLTIVLITLSYPIMIALMMEAQYILKKYGEKKYKVWLMLIVPLKQEIM